MRWSRGETGTVRETRGPPSASFRITYCRFRQDRSIRRPVEMVSRVACATVDSADTSALFSLSKWNTRKHNFRGFEFGEASLPKARNTRRDGGGAGNVNCRRVRVSIVTRAI